MNGNEILIKQANELITANTENRLKQLANQLDISYGELLWRLLTVAKIWMHQEEFDADMSLAVVTTKEMLSKNSSVTSEVTIDREIK